MYIKKNKNDKNNYVTFTEVLLHVSYILHHLGATVSALGIGVQL